MITKKELIRIQMGLIEQLKQAKYGLDEIKMLHYKAQLELVNELINKIEKREK